MDQGAIGDSMYIIYSGECGVYIFSRKDAAVEMGREMSNGEKETDEYPLQSYKSVATLGANTVVGHTAVVDKFDDGRRSATVVAHTDVVTLVLTKNDYQKILYQHHLIQKTQ